MQKYRGFTIIELIVVIAIIAILAGIVLVNVNGYLSKARDARRISDIKNISTALELYYTDHGNYPNGDDSNTDKTQAISIDPDWLNSAYNSINLSLFLKPYMSKLPVDPLNADPIAGFYKGDYFYWYHLANYSPTGFFLCAGLENPKSTADPLTAAAEGYPGFTYGDPGAVFNGGYCIISMH